MSNVIGINGDMFGGNEHAHDLRPPKHSSLKSIKDKLAALHCDPFVGLANIAEDPEAPIELRVKCYVELASYIAPKLRSVEYRAAEEQQQQRGIAVTFHKAEPK